MADVVVLKTPPPKEETLLEIARAASRRLIRALDESHEAQKKLHAQGKPCWVDEIMDGD